VEEPGADRRKLEAWKAVAAAGGNEWGGRVGME